MKISPDITKKIYRNLPDELKLIVATEETSRINDDISKLFNINHNQRLELGDEVTMRLMGITTEKNFNIHIKDRLGISEETAIKITDAVKKEILSKVPSKVLLAQEEYVQSHLKELGEEQELLPAIIPSEKAHEVPKEEPATQIPAQPIIPTHQAVPKPEAPKPPVSNSYPPGMDPYREPI